MMNYKNRIDELEKEIQLFDYHRLKKQEAFKQLTDDYNQELLQINQAILTRKGEIIGLKRLIEEDKNDISTP